ncbi:MAG: efflux RND transporter permease subunit, partial [Candidatus Pacebacteria bacterium]|nr:efflux RND transporter permease subunit [Candidatus Paceibacterota bacterium]
FAIITTILPGASPEDVETLITNDIESAVGNIENIKNLTSTSREGVSTVAIEFQADADIDTSIQDVRDEVDKVRGDLPGDASDPLVSDINFADQPILIAAVSNDLTAADFKAFADTIQDQLEQLPGVSRADVSGVRGPEVTVIVRRESLLAYGLTLGEVVQAISLQNTTLPIGSLETNGIEYTVSLESDLTDPNSIAALPVTTRDGRTIPLSDIALVASGVEEATTISRIQTGDTPSTQAATFTIYKQRGADVTTITDSVRALLTTIDTESDTIATYVSFDAGEDIRRDLRELTRTGLEAVLLVMIALFATLGWREALVAGLSIPLSILVSFIALKESGNTINFISLFSLILSIGILVDSAIVITEAIHVNIRKGYANVLAARMALKEYSTPLIAGTLTTIAVFIPLFTISGVTGEFIKSIPFTVIFVLLASIVVALGMTPLIAAVSFKQTATSPLEERQERYAEAMRAWYRRKIVWFLDHRKRKQWFVWGMVGLFIAALALPITGIVKAVFFPQSDIDFVYIELEEAQGTPLERTDLATRAVEEVLYEVSEIESFTTTVGRGSSFNENAQSGARFASININLAKDRERTSSEIVTDIENRVSAFRTFTVRVSEPNNGPPSGAPVKITLAGDDLSTLKRTSADVSKILTSIPGARDVVSSAEADASEIVLSVDRVKAAELGLSPLTIAQTLRTAVFGTEATTIKKGADEIRVVVKTDLNRSFNTAADTNIATVDTLRELPVQTPNGTILLGSVLNVSLRGANDVISHEDQERTVTITGQLDGGAYATDVTTEFSRRAQAELALPDDVIMTVGGENEDVNQSFKDMFRALIIGMLLVFVILMFEFNQYRLALFVLSVVPLSLIGVLFGLLVTNQPVSFPTMLGFIALAGVVVNHAIILVDVFNRLRIENPQMSTREVVIEGGAIRLRPILLTKITAIIGLIPLLFASDLWMPIAVAMIFGLAFTGVLTLIFLPILYLKFCKAPHEMAGTHKTHDNSPHEEEDIVTRPMAHIGDVLKERYEESALMQRVDTREVRTDTPFIHKSSTGISAAGIALCFIILATTGTAHASVYDNTNIQTLYHEMPLTFTFDEEGTVTGETVSGITFRQYRITNSEAIRLQRFEIGLAFWYVSDRGVIYANNDLTALSLYLSRPA